MTEKSGSGRTRLRLMRTLDSIAEKSGSGRTRLRLMRPLYQGFSRNSIKWVHRNGVLNIVSKLDKVSTVIHQKKWNK